MEHSKTMSHLAKTGTLPISIITILIGFCLLLIAARLIYNVYLHPLARYPGPLYLIVSDIPLAILSLLGISQYPLKAAHDKYGDVVRIAPGTLSYIKPEAWTEIYGYKRNGGGIANFPKDPAFYNEMMLGKETITLASDKDAIPIRRSLNSAFAHRSLLEQESMLQGHVSRLMAQFEKRSIDGNPVDVREWFTFSMFDINSDFAFGEDMGCVRTGVYHDWVKFVIDYFYAATLLHQCHKFWPLNRLLAFCIPPSTHKMQANHTEASLRRVRKRIAQETDRHDFMHFFLTQAKKKQLPMKTIEAQATVVILAGSETASVAETAAVYFMLKHPHIYQKLRADVRTAFDRVENISLQNVLSKLPYLDAVVQETLRIHAPLANGFTRIVPDKNGAYICGKRVPQGWAHGIALVSSEFISRHDVPTEVFVVTGGYTGVGFELSKILYAHNATVYIAGRSSSKAENAIEEIRKVSPESSGHIEFLYLDLSDLSTIKPAVQSFTAQQQRLDVLVNNAGVMYPPKGSTDAQGHDLQVGTNCLGTVRVAWAASIAVHVAAPKPDGMVIDGSGCPRDQGVADNYGQTKVGNVFLARHFAQNTSQNGVVHVAFNPGNLRTELQRHWTGVGAWVTVSRIYDLESV
ncbi:hypothetical protein VSDG_05106 [Cytospora chrysosperma]|uniref:Uncharacterized protein n=1 Tax=Cytospora chrysosperma TaxID=252740 RepID=A0A423VYM5_CYTCH|nr:hypothetical protein VSDG_05106 [Valsa sordida]